MSRKIKVAALHDVTFIPGLGLQLKATISDQTNPGIEMVLVDGMVEIKLKGTTALLPLSNFKCLVMAE